MTAGSLAATSYEYVGNSGSGSFTLSGGTNSVGQPGLALMYLGNNTGSLGAYSLSGSGLLTGAAETIGNSGVGIFTQTGGTNSASGDLYLGNNTGGVGNYSLNGGLLSSPEQYIGYMGSGSFTQSGGTNQAPYLELGPYGSGTYSLSQYRRGGTDRGHGVRRLIMAPAASCSSAGLIKSPPIFYLAIGSSGTYNLMGGSLSAPSEYVGSGGTGNFMQSGGSNSVSNLYVGYYYAGTMGTYTLSNSGRLTAGAEYIGWDSGIGNFNQSGGTHNVSDLYVGYSGSSGTFGLSGSGLLSVSSSERDLGRNPSFNRPAGPTW